jgi:flavodoxin
MREPKILVVYYSRGGNSKGVATEIARALGNADLEEIRDTVERHGLVGYWRSCRDAFRERTTRLASGGRDSREYDLVVVGGPVWAGALSSPVRTWLLAHESEIHNVAFFLTHGGSGRYRVFAQMTDVSGLHPVATLALRAGELSTPGAIVKIARFAEEARRALRTPEVITKEPATLTLA